MLCRTVATVLLVLLSLGSAFEPNQAVASAPASDESVSTRTVKVRDVIVHFDASLPESIELTSLAALTSSLDAVPRVTALPPLTTPVEVFVQDGLERFRQALVEKAGVPIELVAEEIDGYAIERNGVMLMFFTSDVMDRGDIATLAFSHELAHLAVREATQRRPVPQWLNEGYAQWTSHQTLREVDPSTAETFQAIDRATVSSAIHSEVGLLPWASLVTRSRFTRAGTEGWVELAYGQSTLFVDWLARTYGRGALTHFLLALGDGVTATPAFSQTFGPFASVEREFRTSVDALAESLPRGVHRLSPADARTPLFGIVGGVPQEPFHFEVWLAGERVETRDDRLSRAGFRYVLVTSDAASDAADLEVRVSASSLGSITIRGDSTFAPARRMRTPIQLPIDFWEWPNLIRSVQLAN